MPQFWLAGFCCAPPSLGWTSNAPVRCWTLGHPFGVIIGGSWRCSWWSSSFCSCLINESVSCCANGGECGHTISNQAFQANHPFVLMFEYERLDYELRLPHERLPLLEVYLWVEVVMEIQVDLMLALRSFHQMWYHLTGCFFQRYSQVQWQESWICWGLKGPDTTWIRWNEYQKYETRQTCQLT